MCFFVIYIVINGQFYGYIYSGVYIGVYVFVCFQIYYIFRGIYIFIYIYLGEREGDRYIRRFKDICKMDFKIYYILSFGFVCMILWIKYNFWCLVVWVFDFGVLCIYLLKLYFIVLKLIFSFLISREILFFLSGFFVVGFQQGLVWGTFFCVYFIFVFFQEGRGLLNDVKLCFSSLFFFRWYEFYFMFLVVLKFFVLRFKKIKEFLLILQLYVYFVLYYLFR